MSKSRVSAPKGEVGFEVFCGSDVAREMHHAVALNAAGDRLVDRPLPNAESDLVKLFEQLQVHGWVLVVVDQLASIGALAIAVARSRSIAVAYLPGLSMRRISDLYSGEGKTDARDAHIISDAARTLPHAVRGVGPAPVPQPSPVSPRAEWDGEVGIAATSWAVPFDPRLVTVRDGMQTGREPHHQPVGSREESLPPDTWTESGQTPILLTIV